MVLIETALFTPPIGMNLFVLQSVGEARLSEVVRGALPFVVILLATAALLWFWPGLALWIATGW